MAGQPPKYKNPEDIQVKIEEYFQIDGKKTTTGLALYLGFCSKQSLYDNQKREGFSYPIKRALLMIENKYEENLHGNNVAGAVFALKNMGWSDKQEITQDVRMTTIPKFSDGD